MRSGGGRALEHSSSSLRFPKSAHLRRRAEFLRAQRCGRRVHTSHFLVLVHRRGDDGPRLGITVTKKVAPAVGRNRIKRVLREVFRQNRELFPSQCDIVIVAKRGAVGLGYDDVLAEIRRASRSMSRAARPAVPR